LFSLIEAFDVSHVFEKVICVNIAGNFNAKSPLAAEFGKPQKVVYSEFLTIIQPKKGRFYGLREFAKLNYFFSCISFLILLRKISKRNRIRLVRSEDANLNGIIGLLVSKVLRVPLIVGLWGDPQRVRASIGKALVPRVFRKPSIEEIVEKFVIVRAIKILVQNDENTRYPISLGVPREKIFQIPLSVSIDRMHFLPQKDREFLDKDYCFDHLDDTYPNFICVSRLEKVKFVDDLIDLSYQLVTMGINFRLYIVGDGSLKHHILERIKALNLSKYVFLLGEKNQFWLACNLPKFDVFFSPLCGRALLEAALAGCPVIAYDLDWQSDLVKSGETGYLVKPGDVREMSQLAVQLMSDLSLRTSFSTAIRERALTIMNRESKLAEMHEMYSHLIGSE